jgi:hypothetical protein
MKKSKLLVLGLIGLLMAVGLVLVSCGGKCNGSCVANFDSNGFRNSNSDYVKSGCSDSDCLSDCEVYKKWGGEKDAFGRWKTSIKCDC